MGDGTFGKEIFLLSLTIEESGKRYDLSGNEPCKKSFGDLEVLKDISLKVEEGEVLSIIGPSGSGKSTLLRCAAMLEMMDGGDLTYLGEQAVTMQNGKSVYAKPAVLRKIQENFGMVFQSFHLFPHYDVMKNLCDAPIHVQKRNRAEVEAQAEELLQKMGLTGKEKAYPCQLSGGQCQRVAIARALMLNSCDRVDPYF